MYDYDSLAKRFWRDGYLILGDFFAADLMDRLNQVILNHFGLTPDYWHNDEFLTKSQVEVIPWFPQREGLTDFDIIADDPRLHRLTAEIIGEEWQEQYCMMMFSRQGSKGQAWHQDCAPEDPAQFNLNRLVYTHDIDESIGGQTVVVPGTHRKGLLPAGDPHADLENQVVISPKQSDLLLLHGHTWHRVLPIHGSCRFSSNFRSAPKGTPEDITDICVYRNMRYRFSTSEVIEERMPLPDML